MNLETLTTDQLFKALPSFVNVRGDFFHLGVIKGNKRVIMWYRQNESEGGKYLDNTQRSGKTLRDALLSMYNYLIEFDRLSIRTQTRLLSILKSN